MIRLVRCLFAVHLAAAAFGVAAAQSKLDRQLSYTDLAVQGVGEITKTVSGPVNVVSSNTGTVITQSASTTVGALVTLRYTPKPYLGFEFNGGYARYTEGYNVAPYGIQTQANEFTLGYVVTPPYTFYGVKPYASAGLGSIRFAPTTGGGQGAPTQARAAYYYNLGVQKEVIPDRFGVRVGFRQLFFLAPDFLQNYLTITQHTYTTEPMVGFYLRF